MGGGASAVSKKDLRQQNRARETQRQSMGKAVEKFIINVYATCPRYEAMNLILESKRGYQSFKSFLIYERSSELILLHQEIMALIAKPQNQYQLFKDFERIVQKYVLEETETQVVVKNKTKDEISAALLMDLEDPEMQPHIQKLLVSLEDEVKRIMTRDQFFRFIQSKHYKKWRAVESSHAKAHTVEDAIGVDIKEKGPATMERIKNDLETAKIKGSVGSGGVVVVGGNRGSVRRGSVRKSVRDSVNDKKSIRGSVDSFSIHQRSTHSVSSKNFAISAFENVDADVLQGVLNAQSWLSCLLPAVEALPLCFTLSMARKSNTSFPYIFCNHYFEKVTGFQSKDILGKNASFLLCHESEKDKVQLLNDGMKAGVKTTVVITTRTSANKNYKNLIVTRPIYTETKILKYVIILYMDVSKETETDGEYIVKSALMNDLAEMLPETILIDTMDEDELEDFHHNGELQHHGGCFPPTLSHLLGFGLLGRGSRVGDDEGDDDHSNGSISEGLG